ncbi:MAG TPA: methyltransferase domain-containing protein [Polyangiaceae bacterium]|nr:methyltransferase domain-containing protein [Polyangiaceae bacterium]
MPRDELELQRAFWEGSQRDPTYKNQTELMLLDPTGETYSSEEVSALLSIVPDLPAGSRLLELGAGVGRLTTHLARMAGRVIAYDFMAEFIAANRASCAAAGLTNVEHHVADAATLELPAASAHMVFSNWILMYLTDTDARSLVERSASALEAGGHLFVHESCDPGADAASETEYARYAADNPARYRHPAWYEAAFASSRLELVSRHDLTPLYRVDDPSMLGTQVAWLLKRA